MTEQWSVLGALLERRIGELEAHAHRRERRRRALYSSKEPAAHARNIRPSEMETRRSAKAPASSGPRISSRLQFAHCSILCPSFSRSRRAENSARPPGDAYIPSAGARSRSPSPPRALRSFVSPQAVFPPDRHAAAGGQETTAACAARRRTNSAPRPCRRRCLVARLAGAVDHAAHHRHAQGFADVLCGLAHPARQRFNRCRPAGGQETTHSP